MDANSHYRSGRLHDAVDAAISSVKANPSDVNARFFLAELLCFQGEWERAEKQLDTVVKQNAEAGLLALLTRQLIRGEILREQVFAEGRPPQLVGELPKYATLQLELCIAQRENNADEIERLVSMAEEARPPVKVIHNDVAFPDIRDLDDRIAGVMEVITSTGKYYWVPWQSIKTLEFEAPKRPLDLIWRKTLIDVENGPEGEVFIPTRYPLLPLPQTMEWDDALRLGRATTWCGEPPQAVTGLGQRLLLLGDEPVSILELNNIEIQSPS